MALTHRVGWDARLCERSPWLWPLAAAAAHFESHADWPTLADFDAVYRAHTRCQHDRDIAELTFRANVRKQDKRAGGRVVLEALYDARICRAHEVPTRERDWHDLLNMLCFATFPRSKLALHSRQYACLEQRIGPDLQKLPNRRTPEQDALTLFDEGGVVLVADEEGAAQLEALAQRTLPIPPQLSAAASTASLLRESELLCRALASARRLRVVPFGHALFEHELEGLRCPGGCTQVLSVAELWADMPQFLCAVDAALSARIADAKRLLSPRSCGQVRLTALTL